MLSPRPVLQISLSCCVSQEPLLNHLQQPQTAATVLTNNSSSKVLWHGNGHSKSLSQHWAQQECLSKHSSIVRSLLSLATVRHMQKEQYLFEIFEFQIFKFWRQHSSVLLLAAQVPLMPPEHCTTLPSMCLISLLLQFLNFLLPIIAKFPRNPIGKTCQIEPMFPHLICDSAHVSKKQKKIKKDGDLQPPT
jgi:hypothetical protein